MVKVDNAPATIGSGSAPRTLSRFMVFLLNQQITPVFSVPRKPFSQASIEGNNSVFARKFWNSQTFRSLRALDRRLEWFNASSQRYTGYEPPPRAARRKAFSPRVYFIRQVRETPDRPGSAAIDVLNEKIALPVSYANYFVLAEWNLRTGSRLSESGDVQTQFRATGSGKCEATRCRRRAGRSARRRGPVRSRRAYRPRA